MSDQKEYHRSKKSTSEDNSLVSIQMVSPQIVINGCKLVCRIRPLKKSTCKDNSLEFVEIQKRVRGKTTPLYLYRWYHYKLG
jgi:hypothetical protein